MTPYLLDTNHLSPLITPHHPLRQRVLQRRQADDTFAVAAPVLTEMLFGIGMLPRARQNLVEWENMKTDFDHYDITRPDAESAAQLLITLRRRGRQLGTVDALIAAVALRNGLILLTADRDFSAIPELKQENWLTTSAAR